MTDSVGDPVEVIEFVKLDVKQVEDVKEEEGLVEDEYVILPVLETDGVPVWDALWQ